MPLTAANAGLAPVRSTLPNGAVVLAKTVRTAPAVTISASLRAGAAFDPPSHTGLAYFVSRVLDRGTAARSADQIAEALDSRGIAFHQQIGRHTFTLACTCLSEDFAAVLELMADLLQRPTFPAEEVEKRQAEILTLLRQDEDSPAVAAAQGLLRILYGAAHPYGTPTKGTPETILRMDRAALAGFHQLRYAPDGLSLAIVGDLEVEAMLSAAAEQFGAWTARSGPDVTVGPGLRPVTRHRLLIPMPGKAQADIAYGFVALSRQDPRYEPFLIANNILGQYGLGGRLGERIRERMGLAYYVYSASDPAPAEAPLMVRAGVASGDVDRAIEAIDEEVRLLVASGVTDRELADAKQYLIGSLPRLLETTAGIAAFLQEAEFFGLGLDHDLALPERLQAVTRDEVDAVARAILCPERATIVVAGPCDPLDGTSRPAVGSREPVA